MQIECLQENLNKGLSIVTHITGKNNALPILNNVLLETVEDGFRLMSTNLEIGIEVNIRGKIIEQGKIITPAQLFNNYISTLPQKSISIKLEDNKININCDNKFNTKINCLSSDDFPVIPEIEKNNKYILKSKDIKNLLSRVINCVSSNNSRPEINGVLLKIEGESMFVVGTDGYRLSEGVLKIINENNSNEQVIIPLQTAQEINKILQVVEDESLEIFTSTTQILFNFSDIKIVSRTISGNYPDYKQIIPEKFKTDFEVNKSDFINVIKNVGLFTDKNINDIKIEIKENKIILESKNSETGENTVEIETKVNGEENKISFNYQYLLDGLNNINDNTIKINLFDENNPAILQGVSDNEKGFYRYILMPIRG